MRKIIMMTGIATALIAAPALAQSSGNLGGLLGGGGSNNGSSSATNNASRNSAFGSTNRQGPTTIGGISANPQLSSSSSRSNSQANSSRGGGNGSNASNSSNMASNSHSVSLPLAFGGATLGGNSQSVNASRGATTGSTQNTQHGRAGR